MAPKKTNETVEQEAPAQTVDMEAIQAAVAEAVQAEKEKILAEAKGTEVKVWDPMYKLGSDRFEKEGRKAKVRLDGTDAYADFCEIEADCFERPFFLFEKAE